MRATLGGADVLSAVLVALIVMILLYTHDGGNRESIETGVVLNCNAIFDANL